MSRAAVEQPKAGLHPGVGQWQLAPEGAAVHSREKVAVIADVHLGYEWSRGAGGDVVPRHSLHETVAKLCRLRLRSEFTRLIVAGDLVESSRHCVNTARDVESLIEWLEAQGIELVRVRGNHDPAARPTVPWEVEVAGWTIAHGHRPFKAGQRMIGHHHPVLCVGAVSAPCFLVGPSLVVLPAFSDNAAGLNVATRAIAKKFRGTDMRCVAGLGSDLLDFGPLDTLESRIGRAQSGPASLRGSTAFGGIATA
jgi:putative SbcD/Mre11-related phosphoesterase